LPYSDVIDDSRSAGICRGDRYDAQVSDLTWSHTLPCARWRTEAIEAGFSRDPVNATPGRLFFAGLSSVSALSGRTGMIWFCVFGRHAQGLCDPAFLPIAHHGTVSLDGFRPGCLDHQLGGWAGVGCYCTLSVGNYRARGLGNAPRRARDRGRSWSGISKALPMGVVPFRVVARPAAWIRPTVLEFFAFSPPGSPAYAGNLHCRLWSRASLPRVGQAGGGFAGGIVVLRGYIGSAGCFAWRWGVMGLWLLVLRGSCW